MSANTDDHQPLRALNPVCICRRVNQPGGVGLARFCDLLARSIIDKHRFFLPGHREPLTRLQISQVDINGCLAQRRLRRPQTLDEWPNGATHSNGGGSACCQIKEVPSGRFLDSGRN